MLTIATPCFPKQSASHHACPRRSRPSGDAVKPAPLPLLRRRPSENSCALTFLKSFRVRVPVRSCMVEAVPSQSFDRARTFRFHNSFKPRCNSFHNLHPHRTQEPGGHKPGWILCRPGVKGPLFAHDHAVVESIRYRNLQHVLSWLNQVCNVCLVRTQQKCPRVLAIHCHLGNISYIAKIEDEPHAPIRASYSKGRRVNSSSRKPAQLAIQRPVHQFRHISMDDGAFPDRKSTRLNSSHLGISYA